MEKERGTERVRRAVPVTAASCPAPLGARLLRLAAQAGPLSGAASRSAPPAPSALD